MSRPETELIARFESGSEKWQSADMIQMRMGKEDIGVYGSGLINMLAEKTQTASRIEYQKTRAAPNF